ncbi:MAG: TadE/TadG family type IV pilus assembly protein [Pyrinomonadaceae bacterium]
MQLNRGLRRFLRLETGTQMIEFAIVFPILILLFAGVVELGRLFHTYTSLAKATRSGARYLSTVQNVGNSTSAGKNIVLCGSASGCGGQNQPAIIVPNLTAGNIVVTPPPAGTAAVKYVSVQITGFTYQPAVFNLNAMTGSTFNFTLSPSTRMRYMPN